MANRSYKNVKRFVDNISEEVKNTMENGGKGATITGSYLFSPTSLCEEVRGYRAVTFDFEAFCDYLEASGVDVDAEGFFNKEENDVYISTLYEISESQDGIGMSIYKDEGDIYVSFSFCMFANGTEPLRIRIGGSETFDYTMSLRQILENVSSRFIEPVVLYFKTYWTMRRISCSNEISIHYTEINEFARYILKDVDGFFENVFVEYTPDSSDSSY